MIMTKIAYMQMFNHFLRQKKVRGKICCELSQFLFQHTLFNAIFNFLIFR